MTNRRLISIRRHVPHERRAEYDRVWGGVRDAAAARGAHAWRFSLTDSDDVYLEFLEFGTEEDVREDLTVIEGIRALHALFGDPYPPPNTLEEWVEEPTITVDPA